MGQATFQKQKQNKKKEKDTSYNYLPTYHLYLAWGDNNINSPPSLETAEPQGICNAGFLSGYLHCVVSHHQQKEHIRQAWTMASSRLNG